jgi:hypothetical protein
MVIGCAIANYESLAGGMVAASAALVAGWLAWSAVQVQIATEEKRASAERVEVETVLQNDLDYLAEGLSSIWKILLAISASPRPVDIDEALEGVIFGIRQIVKRDWLNTSRKMVTALGWERRRYYEELFASIERLQQEFHNIDNFDVDEALRAVGSVSNYFELLRPDTSKYFTGLWRPSPKAWTLGYTISNYAGLFHIERAAK